MPKIIKANWQPEGKGPKVIKVIGRQNLQLPRLDPFLMLDYFYAKLPGGFPDHPHRGFEAVTYMIEGVLHHQDFKGYRGTIKPGDCQWLTAGKGIVHAGMPGSDKQDSIGFQLWINLATDKKNIPPSYQELNKQKIPIVHKQNFQLSIISGSYEGIKGPITNQTQTFYYHIKIHPKGLFSIKIPSKMNSIIFVYKGCLLYQGDCKVDFQETCVLDVSQEQEINHTFQSIEGASLVLIGGQPLNQPCVQRGPYCTSTQQQLQQSIIDYKEGKNGFQGSKQWKSKLKQLANGKLYEQIY